MSAVMGTARTTIKRSVSEAFAFAADLTNEPTWSPDIVATRPEPHSPVSEGLGSVWVVSAKFMGVKEYEVEVTGFELDRLIEYTTRTGPMRPKATCIFEPDADGTLFTRRVEIPVEGPWRLMKPLLQRMATRRQAAHVEGLKRVLEREDD